MKNPHEREEIPIQELLNPRNSPELGFQSYEMLKGNAETRAAQMHAFMTDSVRNPDLEYPRLDTHELQQGINALHDILDASQEQDSKALSDAVWESASYRMAEMYWLMSASRLQLAAEDTQSPNLDTLARRTQELNEGLYGVPEREITKSIELFHPWAWKVLKGGCSPSGGTFLQRRVQHHLHDQHPVLSSPSLGGLVSPRRPECGVRRSGG